MVVAYRRFWTAYQKAGHPGRSKASPTPRREAKMCYRLWFGITSFSAGGPDMDGTLLVAHKIQFA